MPTRVARYLIVVAVVLCSSTAHAQFDVTSQAADATGPWSDAALTTLTVPQVADGSISLDGSPSKAEYGGFEGVTVTPGDNAWILDWPNDRQWDNAEDSSFTFFLAHDAEFFYVGVDVKDDVVNTDDPNSAFWKDDSIEIVTDIWNDNYDNNTDNSNDLFGGHNYLNYEGRFSGWDDETGEITNERWSSGVDWTYGEDGDIFGNGGETETGWNLEVRFSKAHLEDPDAGIKLVEGTKIGFNIGLDDDDKFGPGENGDASRTQDLELQYFWANRERFLGWNADVDDGFFTEEEIASSFEALYNGTVEDDEFLSLDYDWGLNGGGRLSHGGAGEIIFGGLAEVGCDANSGGDVNGSGVVDFNDFLLLAENFGQAASDHTTGDINCSGSVDFNDFLLLAENFGKTVGGAASVPEPSSFALFCLCTLPLALMRSRRR